MNYLEFTFKLDQIEPYRDMLVYYLNELNFETHQETETGLLSYVQKTDYIEGTVAEIVSELGTKVEFDFKEIEQQNWNAVWEAAFDPVHVTNDCVICAPFHNIPDKPYKIVLSPKMAFGTGHHATTYLMSKQLLEENLVDQKVLDMGCGTSVLAILAEKLGASPIEAIDIDEWAYHNSLENLELNQCSKIKVEQGDASLLRNRLYNLILANINKNILLQDMQQYANCLKPQGVILFSGFYQADIDDIVDRGEKFGLSFVTHYLKDDWAMVKMIKL